MTLPVSCTCCALVIASAECCGYLCYLSAVMRLWPLWSNPVPLSLIRCTCVVPLFLRCCVTCHMVLIALRCGKVLWLPLRPYCLYNRLSQFWFDKFIWRQSNPVSAGNLGSMGASMEVRQTKTEAATFGSIGQNSAQSHQVRWKHHKRHSIWVIQWKGVCGYVLISVNY